MSPRFFNAQRLVLTTLVGISALAAVPIGLCVSEVTELRSSVAQIDKAGAQAKQARDVVDKVGQSVFSFTAVALKLSPEERDAILAETDEHLRTFEQAVHVVEQWSTGMLPTADRERLDEAIRSIAHSWEEIRSLSGSGISEAEETFHFLKIFGDTKAARDVLVTLEAAATQAAERASAQALERIEQTVRLLILIMLIGGALTACAAFGVYFFARRLHQTNRRLERMNEGLRQRDERFSAALSNMPHGLCMFDGQARLIICNEPYAAMYNLPPHLRQAGTTLRQIIDHRLSIGIGPADPSRLFGEAVACPAHGAPTHQKLEMQDGRTIRISHQPLSGGGWVATHEDVTDAIKAEARIAYLAHHDALTGLPNRALFREEVERALARVRRGEQCAPSSASTSTTSRP